MADMDVDVPEQRSAAPKGKTKEAGKDGKKRFEVKKVRARDACVLGTACLLCRLVERCISLGVGYVLV